MIQCYVCHHTIQNFHDIIGKDTRFFFLQVVPAAHFNKYNATSPINNVHRSRLIPQGRPASKLLSIHGKKNSHLLSSRRFCCNHDDPHHHNLGCHENGDLHWCCGVVLLLHDAPHARSRDDACGGGAHDHPRALRIQTWLLEILQRTRHCHWEHKRCNTQRESSRQKFSIVEKAKMLENFFPLRTKTTSLNIRIRTNISCLCSSKTAHTFKQVTLQNKIMLQKFLLHKERKGFQGPQKLKAYTWGNHKIRTEIQNCHLFFWKLTANPTWKLFCTSRKTTNLQSRHRDWSANLIDNRNNPVELLYTKTRYSSRSTHPATNQ